MERFLREGKPGSLSEIEERTRVLMYKLGYVLAETWLPGEEKACPPETIPCCCGTELTHQLVESFVREVQEHLRGHPALTAAELEGELCEAMRELGARCLEAALNALEKPYPEGCLVRAGGKPSTDSCGGRKLRACLAG